MDRPQTEGGGNGHRARAAAALVRGRPVSLAARPSPFAGRHRGCRQAVVLVGGQGTRLRPITSRVPKPAAPVMGRPFIGYVLDNLARHGVDDVVFSSGYLAAAIEAEVGDGSRFGLRARYAVEDTPLGTAGALGNACSQLGQGSVLVLNGDVLCDADLTTLVAFHEDRGAAATLLLTPVEDPRLYGLVELAENGRVATFLEKPGAGWSGPGHVSAGVYVLEPEVLAMIPPGCVLSLEHDIFPDLAFLGRMYGFVGTGYWRDIGTPRSYLDAHIDLLRAPAASGLESQSGGGHHHVSPTACIDERARVVPPVHVEDGASIGAGACVGPFAVVGRGTRVGASALIVESVLQDEVTVGAEAVVERSVVVRRATVGEAARLSDAVVGEGCRVGARNVLASGVSLFPDVVLPDGSIGFSGL